MRRFAGWLLRLYPARWRQRYGAELAGVLEERGLRLRDLPDLMRGALDARFSPQLQLAAEGAPPAPVTEPPRLPAPSRPPTFGPVGPPLAAISRRSFMRRMLGLGMGLLSLEFMGGTLAFLWPQLQGGLGSRIELGTIAALMDQQPRFANGWPFDYRPARLFLINTPAARELAMGRETSVPEPDVHDLLALWRKCPHLGCQVPDLCTDLRRFQCRCHGSQYNVLGEKLHNGPATRGMDRFPLEVEEGILFVDTRRRIAGPPVGALTFVDPHPYDAECH
jgi:hypothetical protein